MKDKAINVPGVAWWVLALLVIPVVQTWLAQTFPGSLYAWVPLAVAVLGAVAKWVQWILTQNDVQIAPMPDGVAAAPVQEEKKRMSVRWFLLG
jgi:hypothetical protein